MRIATYNVRSGGFDGYDDTAASPPRLAAIGRAVSVIDADIIGLVDTFRWHELFTDDETARYFGYASAFQTLLRDDRVDGRIGLTLMCRFPAVYGAVRFGPRYGIKAVVSPPGRPDVVVYLVYLDDLSEFKRLGQMTAVIRDAAEHDDRPVVVMGDMNAVRPQTILARAAPLLERLAAIRPLRRSYLTAALREMAVAQTVPLIKDARFDEAPGRGRRATCFVGPIGLGLDYIWVRGGRAGGYRRWPFRTSDHRPVSIEITVP